MSKWIGSVEVEDDMDTATLEEVQTLAIERGVPGPDVVEHVEGYEGECYCQLCMSYF